MLFKEIICAKRDGRELSADQIGAFVSGLADGSLPAEQISALAMAILLKSMNARETGALTLAMARSGSMIDWAEANLSGPVVDKHSTGGVGDKVSFLLAPIAAACGCFVPMISGRGLGHTGGTLDKASAIPGYNAYPGLEKLKIVVQFVGCAIIGQTDDLAPADRRLYAIRDVTGTVESIPLITASILSKKVAAGNAGLVMDVKVGTGAFMTATEEARALARSIIGAAAESDLKTHAVLTDMSQILGWSAGNAVEIAESVAYLRGEAREPRLHEVVIDLTAEMLIVSGLETDRASARLRCEKALASGKAAEVFARMVAALGGPTDFLERSADYLPRAAVVMPVFPETEGYLAAVDGRAIGNAIINLGGGRRAIDDRLDLSVGFTQAAPVGARVGSDAPLAFVHARNADEAATASQAMRAACRIAPSPPLPSSVILERITKI